MTSPALTPVIIQPDDGSLSPATALEVRTLTLFFRGFRITIRGDVIVIELTDCLPLILENVDRAHICVDPSYRSYFEQVLHQRWKDS